MLLMGGGSERLWRVGNVVGDTELLNEDGDTC